MRLSQLFGAFAPGRSDEVAGVTIDVMTGIVAGLAFVLAMMILATTLKQPQSAPIPAHVEDAIARG
jgi:hypothetical protein